MHGMSDLHLQVMERRLKRRYGVEIDDPAARASPTARPSRSRPRVTTATRSRRGGRGQFGECYLRVKPAAEGSGRRLHRRGRRRLDPAQPDPGRREGHPRDRPPGRPDPQPGGRRRGRGLRRQVPRRRLRRGQLQDGRRARLPWTASTKAGPVLLEPVMELDDPVPTESAGTIFSDLTSHRRGARPGPVERGRRRHHRDQGPRAAVDRSRPTSATSSRQTAGEGTYSMSFHDYAQVPAGEQHEDPRPRSARSTRRGLAARAPARREAAGVRRPGRSGRAGVAHGRARVPCGGALRRRCASCRRGRRRADPEPPGRSSRAGAGADPCEPKPGRGPSRPGTAPRSAPRPHHDHDGRTAGAARAPGWIRPAPLRRLAAAHPRGRHPAAGRLPAADARRTRVGSRPAS